MHAKRNWQNLMTIDSIVYLFLYDSLQSLSERDVAPWYGRSLMVRWVVGSILHGVDPMSYLSFQPVIHDWCNKGRGMYYPVCGMVHIKESLLLIGKSGRSGFPFSQSELLSSFNLNLSSFNLILSLSVSFSLFSMSFSFLSISFSLLSVFSTAHSSDTM